MKDKQAKYPQLRFKGFTDPWEQRKLSDFSKTTYGGGTPKTAVTEYWDGNIPWIQSSNLTVDDVQEVNLDKFITDDAIKNSAAKLIPANSIAIVTRVGVGKLTLMKQEFATSQDFLSLSELHVDEQFGLYSIYKLLQKELNNVQGTSIKGMTKADLLTKDIMIPVEKDEQIKIGSFFKQLDHLITLYQRKLDLLKEQKKGYLQKMFPKNGAKVPELRFAGFADDWEQRKLGEEAQLTMGQSPNSENYTKNPDDYILVQGNADMKNGRVVPRVWTTQITKKAEKSDLILSVRAPVGDIGKTDYDVVIGRGVAAIKGNEFIFQNLGKMKSDGYWTRYSTGSTFESINSSDIKEAIISIPRIEEQQKIGSFFKQLDNTIALHQRKLDLLKEQKKGFLQKMFV